MGKVKRQKGKDERRKTEGKRDVGKNFFRCNIIKRHDFALL